VERASVKSVGSVGSVRSVGNGRSLGRVCEESGEGVCMCDVLTHPWWSINAFLTWPRL